MADDDVRPAVRAICTSMGWRKKRGKDVFQATIEFREGAPDWPLGVIWNEWPLLVAVQEPAVPHTPPIRGKETP
jgi:hypothetical protein